MIMTTMMYVFADGYWCWVAGRLSAADLRAHTKEHGALVKVVAC